jgi:hypothetical protein
MDEDFEFDKKISELEKNNAAVRRQSCSVF